MLYVPFSLLVCQDRKKYNSMKTQLIQHLACARHSTKCCRGNKDEQNTPCPQNPLILARGVMDIPTKICYNVEFCIQRNIITYFIV